MAATDLPDGAPDELVGLMARYQGGDAEAFETLYVRLAPRLRRYLQALARDAGWVEDLVQETFLHLHRSRHTYGPGRPVAPWAFGIARHVFLMSRRSRRRHGDYPGLTLEQVPESAIDGPEAVVLARDEVRRGLRTLTPGTRRAVLLHHLFGLDFDAIGQRLGILGQAARLRSSRGVAKLRDVLSKKDNADEG